MSTRESILGKLRSAAPTRPLPLPDLAAHYAGVERIAPERLVDEFVARITAWHADVHRVTRDSWSGTLARILADKGVRTLLHAPATAQGGTLAAELARHAPAVALRTYDRPIEGWKAELFDGIDAALTTTRGAIAETGTLILWPDADEPRLMSLVPPIHIALVDAAAIHANLYDAITAQGWAAGLPTNALLVSGPSKTADIQQTLAYGAHGPKELIVLLIETEQAQ